MRTQTAKAMEGAEFREFFANQLKEIYWSEKHWHEALRKLEGEAASRKLICALRKHILDAGWKVQSLEEIFHLLYEEPKEKKSDAIAGLIKEAEVVIKDTEKDSHTRDAGLILAAQKVCHYGIAVYGTLRVFASHMQRPDIRAELEKMLDNEKQTDAGLSTVAENYINDLAADE